MAVADKIGDRCPECGGPFRETYRQVKL